MRERANNAQAWAPWWHVCLPAYLPFRLCTLMLNALTRSSFGQEHKVTSVGNGWVRVVVQKEESLISGVLPPPQNESWHEAVLSNPKVPPVNQTSSTTISSRSSSPRPSSSEIVTASYPFVQSRAPGTCRLFAWRAIEEVLVLQRVLAPRLFLGSVI